MEPTPPPALPRPAPSASPAGPSAGTALAPLPCAFETLLRDGGGELPGRMDAALEESLRPGLRINLKRSAILGRRTGRA